MPTADIYKNSTNKTRQGELFQKYLPLVAHATRTAIARKVVPSNYEYNDLYGYGVLGLQRIVSKVRLEKGIEAYLFKRIYGAIIENSWYVGIPRNAWRTKNKLKHFIEEYKKKNNRIPTEAEIKAGLGYTAKQLRNALHIYNHSYVSLDEPCDSNAVSSIRIKDTIADTNEESPAIKAEKKDLMGRILEIIEDMPYKMQYVMKEHYIHDKELRDIASEIKKSYAHVHNLRKQGILVIQKRLNEEDVRLPEKQYS